MSRIAVFVLVGVSTVLAVSLSGIADDGHELLESTMKDYFKGKTSIVARSVKGQATADEKAKLAAVVKKLAEVKPPRGDADAWKAKIAKLVAATEAVANDAPGAAALLKEAANCKACHKEHKPD